MKFSDYVSILVLPKAEIQNVVSEMIFILRNDRVTINITIAKIVTVRKLSYMNIQQQFKGREMTKIKRLEIITLKTQENKILVIENSWTLV